MSAPNAILAEPLTLGQETIARGTWSSRKTVLLGSLLVGLVLVVFLNPMTYTRSGVEEPAIDIFGTSPMSTCPRSSAVPTSVSAYENTLRSHGIAITPVAKFALTSAAATRDVSMAAQAREEFSKLDPVTQAKFKKLSKDIVVRAASLKPEEMAGITAPLGFFDPLGFSKKGDIAVFRNAELKHGRVCMLAVLGQIVSEKFHPLFDNWGDAPFSSAIGSHFTASAASTFWPAYWVMTAGHEIATELSGGFNEEPKDRAPGDYGFDPLNLKPKDPAAFKEMQNKELNNGRLAMFAAAGFIAQELVTGKKIL